MPQAHRRRRPISAASRIFSPTKETRVDSSVRNARVARARCEQIGAELCKAPPFETSPRCSMSKRPGFLALVVLVAGIVHAAAKPAAWDYYKNGDLKAARPGPTSGAMLLLGGGDWPV